jgi:LuxR family maltose regulon positive regulatory protein
MTPAAWKVAPPHLADRLLERERLTSRLEQCLGETCVRGDVFLVSAPAGYGKTTLLAQWARTSSVPVAWYHLDGGDDDPVALLRGLTHALRVRLPRGEWEIERMLARIRRGALSPLEVRRAVDLLIAGIAQHVRKPLALILTGVSELSSRSGGHAALDFLITRSPDHLRLVLESREAPRLRLSPLLTRRRLEGCGADDLRVRADELVDLVRLYDIALDGGQMAALHELCEGWITGVLLATDLLLPGFLPSYMRGDFNREAIFDFFAGEVIDTLPIYLADFASAASVLRHMTPSLCEQLLGHEDAQESLVALERRTGFVTRVGRRPEEPIYRFQQLLRQALLRRLEEDDGGRARRQGLHLRAGMLLEDAGDLEEAAH